MGLSQSCLGAPTVKEFEVKTSAGAQAAGKNEREVADAKPPASECASVSRNAGDCVGIANARASGNGAEPDTHSTTITTTATTSTTTLPDALPDATLETAQLSGALTATATTASLQSTFMSSEGYPHSGWELGPPYTDDEQRRVQAIRALDVLDTVSQGRRCRIDEEADMVLGAVMQMFNAVTAMLVLFDDTRIIIRNAKGFMKPGEFPHRWSFCAYTLTKHRPQTLVVPDATKDSRFVENPFVRGAPHIRFYCGAPLVAASGHILGTLCFADDKPRPGFDVSQCYVVNNMAELMVRQLERFRANAGPAGPIDAETTALARVARTIECYESVTGLVDISLAEGWMLMYANEAWEALCSPWSRKQMVGRPLQQLLALEEAAEDPAAVPPPAEDDIAENGDAAAAVRGNADGVGSKKRPASAAGPPFSSLEKTPLGSRAGSAVPNADAGDGVGGCPSAVSRSASGSGGSGASYAVSGRNTSTTSSTGGVERGIVMDGCGECEAVAAADAAGAGARLAAMPEQERRRWRARRERGLPVAAWQRHAGALRSGEEVELGRVRLLMPDGQPSTTVVRATVRSANCHVLDAAVRMPVGVPHQLGLPPSILAAAAGDSAAPGESAAAAPPPLPPAAAEDSKPEPLYCIVTLTAVDDQGDGEEGQGEEGEQRHQCGLLSAAAGSGGDAAAATGATDHPTRVSRVTPSPLGLPYNKGRPSMDNAAAVRDLGSPTQRPSCRAQGGQRPSMDASGVYGSVGGRNRGLAPIAASVGTAARGSAASMLSSASLGGVNWAYGMQPFPGLRLQHLLGKGGYGRVFAASYKGQKVAAKVISNAMLKSAACVNGVTLEALLTQEIEHPYIVRTYKCVVRSYGPAEWPSAAGMMSVRNSSHQGVGLGGTYGGGVGGPYRSAASLPPGMSSAASATVPAGPSEGADLPRAGSRLACASEAGRTSAATPIDPKYARGTAGCAVDAAAKAGGSALAASDLPRAVAAAAAVAPTPPAEPMTAAAAPSPPPPLPAAVAAVAAEAARHDFDSFDAGGEEAEGGMIDQLTSAAPPVYVPEPASAVSAAAGAPPVASQSYQQQPHAYLPTHLAVSIAAERQSVAVSGAMAQSGAANAATHGSIMSTANAASVEQVVAALAAPGTRGAAAPPRVPPCTADPADLFSPNSGAGGAAAAGSVFSAAAAAAAAAAATGADASFRNSTRTAADAALTDGETWILQEFCGGGTLQEAIDTGRLRTEPSRLRGSPHMPYILLTAQEIASAMACVHSRGYMHGDLSAVNVLLTEAPAGNESEGSGCGWVAKVSDFGLAKHLPDPTQPFVSSAYGVITHCAPEVLKTHAQTQKADVYSFGVLLWQMFTGSRPWANMNRFQIFGAVTSGASPGLRFLPTQQPPTPYRDLAMRCMSPDPAARPTFAEVCEELRVMTYEAASAGQLP